MHDPPHADGTVSHIPTRSAYLCDVLVYKFEFPTFNEIKNKALANTFSICSASLNPRLRPSFSFTGKAQRGSGLRVQSYNNFLKQHHFL